MLKNYKIELITIAAVFGLISYTVYSFAETVKSKPVVVTAKKEAVKPAGKKPVDTKASRPKEVKPEAEPKKDPNRKKPILKKKYADKK